MANQTVTTVVNYDDASISGLLNDETITINGGSVTVDSDVRWNQQAAVFGNVTLSATLGGDFVIDGTKVWELPFDASTGNVPVQDPLGSNTVTGSGGATGELLRVWATGSLEPEAAGGAMPATGWIKLRSKTGTFADNEVVTLPGGATITLTGPGKRSWIHVVGGEARTLTMPRLGNFSVDGDWYELGLTDGTDNQQIQFPVRDECPAVQVETAPGSGVYEWWSHGAMRWINNVAPEAQTVAGTVAVANNISGPPGTLGGGRYSNGTRLRETATNAVHGTGGAFGANTVTAGTLTFRTWVKKETRRWVLVQAHSGTARFGALVDLDAGTIIANPTVGTPTGTSSTISAVGDGWFQVDLTLTHALANAGSINIYLANSATPTYDASGLPTYLGATTEGVYYAEAQVLHPTLQQIATDERGTYFFSDATTGTLTFAKRDANYNAGFKPPSGCRVRIPNVILSSATAGDWNRNTLNATATTRYDLTTTSAGAVTIRHATCNWYIAAANPATVTLEDSAFSLQVSLANVAGATTITNCAVGPSRSISSQPLVLTNCFSGGTITNSRFVRHIQVSFGIAVGLSVCKGFTFTNCRADSFPTAPGVTTRGSYFNYQASTTDGIAFTDCTSVGAGFNLSIANNTTITNTKHADVIVGATSTVAAYGAAIVTSDTVTVDGFSAFANLANVHPYAGIISVNTSSANVELRNVGTPAAPYDGGTINLMGLIAALLGTSLNITLRRVYVQNTRTAAISSVNTMQNVRLYNVWGDGADSQVMVAVDALAQGCRWANPSTVQTAVYGTHWEDAFVSTTDGRLMVIGNEPIATTTDQCSFTFGAGAGFTSGGGVSLPNLTDTVTWTMPYYALGHTGIAKFTSGVFTNPWFVTGANVQLLEFEYQIDTGSGFSAWKHLLNQGRRGTGGGAGTNTVALVTSERTAMLRQPQIGDYVQSGSNKLPHGTTITNVTGDTLTLSNNFTGSLVASEPILIWKDIADETINPSTGYKLKVRVKVNTANASTVFSFLRIPFDTDAVNQQIQYPLPVTQNIGSVTSILAGSRIQVYNVTTDTEVANEVVAGTEWTYPYDEGTDFTAGDLIRVRLARHTGATASIGYEGFALANANGWSLLADQQNDTVYAANGIDGTTVTEFAPDFPNVQVDINDPDGETSVDRLYAWFSYIRTTEEGIRQWLGGILAEDEANYRIRTARLDLKLDNLASTGVIFTGGHRLYRDDGAPPVVSSTTGGGSIVLYADKVYVAETGVSGLTAGESAKLDAIAGIDQNVTAVKKVLTNKRVTNPSTGQQIIYDDDNTTTLLSGAIYEDVAGTQPYRGQGVERADRLT